MRRLWTFEPADCLGMGFGIWIREYRARDISHNGIYGLLSHNLKSKIQNLKLVVAAVVIVTTAVAHAGAALKWQDDWQRVVEAAKKEGQVVVYISGYEAILPDFEKEFPEIKVVAITGKRKPTWTASAGGTARGKIYRRCFQHRGESQLPTVSRRQGARSNQAGADLAGSHRPVEVVSEEASVFRPRRTVCFQLCRLGDLRLDQLPHQARRCEGVQVLRRSLAAEVERQDRDSRYP